MLLFPLIPDFIFYFYHVFHGTLKSYWTLCSHLELLNFLFLCIFLSPVNLIPLFQIFPVFDSLNLEWTLHLAMRELKIILLSLCCFDRYLMEEWMSADQEVVGRDLPNANVPWQMTLDLTVRGAPLLKPVMRKQALMSP